LWKNAVAITLLSAAQAVDLRSGGGRLGAGTRPVYRAIRAACAFIDADRALDGDIRAVIERIDRREFPVLN
jgi:histidine ammonia-lyase